MVSENHPNKCPHICLYLIVNQQTCRSGRPFAGGIPRRGRALYVPAVALQAFFQKSFAPPGMTPDEVHQPPEGPAMISINSDPSNAEGRPKASPQKRGIKPPLEAMGPGPLSC